MRNNEKRRQRHSQANGVSGDCSSAPSDS